MDRRWAKLGGAYPATDLRRGAWYQVVGIDRDMVTLDRGADTVSVHESLLDFRDSKPTFATILPVQPTMPVKPPGKPVAMMKFEAICPERHEIGEVLPTVDRVRCVQCQREYRVELE